MPTYAHAAFLDKVKGFFGVEKYEAATPRVDTVQTVDILEPRANPSPRVKGVVVDESILATLPEGEFSEKQVPLISTYIVRDGDTLSSIAKMFNVSVNTILWSNNLSKKDSIRIGQNLVILPISGVSHMVKSGDTLSSIAKKYKADVDEIMNFNGIVSSNELVVGEPLIIPDGEPTAVVSKTPAVLTKGGVPGLITGGYTRDPAGYFTRPIDSGTRTRGLHGFNGIDLANSLGTPIHAAAAGTVIISKNGGWNGGYGSYVVIRHANGMQTLYGHLSLASASVGDTVQQGQTIGKMGSTGKSTGSHLHFEVRGGKNPF